MVDGTDRRASELAGRGRIYRITDDGARSIPDVHFLVSLALELWRGGVTDLELVAIMARPNLTNLLRPFLPIHHSSWNQE